MRRHPFGPFLLIFLLLAEGACQDDLSLSVCGNGKVEPGEDCDGSRWADLYRWRTSCADWGWHDGYVGCTPGCRLDFAACEAGGRCGDGAIDRRSEDCDGANLGDQTCVTLGTHGGTLACTADCRWDRSGCAACGDGVLQPEYGEQVETNFDGCAGAGFFGGLSATFDCRFAATRYCGDFRLIVGPGSVKDPVPVLDAAGELWLAGTVQGAFPGFDNPGCPHLEPLTWEVAYDPEDVNTYEDGYHYPDCDDHFFGPAGITSVPAVTVQGDDDAPPVQVLGLGVRGFVVLRHRDVPGDRRYQIDWVTPDGTLRHTEQVLQDGGWSEPRLVPAGEDEFALFTFSMEWDVLQFTRLGVGSPGVISSATLPRVVIDGLEYGLDEYAETVHTWGLVPGFYRVLIWLRNGPYERGLFLLTLDARGAELVVSGALRLELPGHTVLHVEEAPGSQNGFPLTLAWLGSQNYPHPALFTGLAYSDGLVTTSAELALPQGAVPVAVLREPGGGWLVAGWSRAPDDASVAMTGYCWLGTGPPEVFAALRYDADGNRTGGATFAIPSGNGLVGGPQGAGRVACGTDRVRYLQDGGTLLVAGTWDRSSYFCTPHEPSTLFQADPVHACGIYLVRLTPASQ